MAEPNPNGNSFLWAWDRTWSPQRRWFRAGGVTFSILATCIAATLRQPKDPSLMQTATALVVAAVLATVVYGVLSLGWNFAHAPYQQRNELRRALAATPTSSVSVEFPRYGYPDYGNLTNHGPAATFKINPRVVGGDSDGWVEFSNSKDREERRGTKILRGDSAAFRLVLAGGKDERWSFELSIHSEVTEPVRRLFHVRTLPLGLVEVRADEEGWKPRDALWDDAAVQLLGTLNSALWSLDALDPDDQQLMEKMRPFADAALTAGREAWLTGPSFGGLRERALAPLSEARRHGDVTPRERWEAERAALKSQIAALTAAMEMPPWD